MHSLLRFPSRAFALVFLFFCLAYALFTPLALLLPLLAYWSYFYCSRAIRPFGAIVHASLRWLALAAILLHVSCFLSVFIYLCIPPLTCATLFRTFFLFFVLSLNFILTCNPRLIACPFFLFEENVLDYHFLMLTLALVCFLFHFRECFSPCPIHPSRLHFSLGSVKD